MRTLAWNEIKARFTILFLAVLPSNYPQLQRLLSFGPSNNESTESPPPAPGDLESQPVVATPVAVMEMQSRSPPASPADAEVRPMSLAELAIPAVLCVTFYGSIPQEVQVDHRDKTLYNPLVTFVCLGVLTSLCNIIYALVKPDGEYVKKRVMGVAVAFVLVAFVLRVRLLQ